MAHDIDRPATTSTDLALPTQSLTVYACLRLPDEHEQIEAVWPRWGWLVSDADLAVVGLVAFHGEDASFAGYEPDHSTWHVLHRVGLGELDVPAMCREASAALETWLCDRYDRERLSRLEVHGGPSDGPPFAVVRSGADVLRPRTATPVAEHRAARRRRAAPGNRQRRSHPDDRPR